MKFLLKSSVPLLIIGLVSLSTIIAGATISDDDLLNDELLMEEAQNDDDYDPVNWFMDGDNKSGEDGLSDDGYGEDKDEDLPEYESSGDGTPVSKIVTLDATKFIKDVPSTEADKLPMTVLDTGVSKCQQQKTDDGVLVINCDGRQLLTVPGDLDVLVVDLYLSNNNITELGASSFPEKFYNLETLNLTKNFIKTIDKNAFISLPHVEEIDLSSNGLTTLEPETFSGLVNLRELDLGENPLKLPASSPFLLAPDLRRLGLVGCGLTALPESTFDGVASLEELDLGDNPIAEDTPIVPSVFAALTNLSILTLPQGSPPALITDVCRSHGLLSAVCLGDCAAHAVPCHLQLQHKDDDKDEVQASDEVPAPPLVVAPQSAAAPAVVPQQASAPVIPVAPAADPVPPVEQAPPAQEDMSSEPAKKGESDDKSASDESDSIPESSRSGVSGAGVNKTIIGLVIGGLLAAVAAVVVKKNWSKIRGKRDNDRRTGAGAQRPTPCVVEVPVRSPEEVPLQSKTPPV